MEVVQTKSLLVYLQVDALVAIVNQYVPVCKCTCHKKKKVATRIIGCEIEFCPEGCLQCTQCEMDKEDVCPSCPSDENKRCKQHASRCVVCGCDICADCERNCGVCADIICWACTHAKRINCDSCQLPVCSPACQRRCDICKKTTCSMCTLNCSECDWPVCVNCAKEHVCEENYLVHKRKRKLRKTH